MADFDLREELSMVTPLIAQGAKIYIFGCGANYQYNCDLYRNVIGVDFTAQIDGFIDNDTSKQVTIIKGKPVYSLDDIDNSNSVIIISVLAANMDIAIQLAENGFIFRHSFFMSDEFMNILMRWEYKRLLPFKNKHKGERCFIIGNGPSLRAEDLDKLKNEVTFASNKIYLMFDKTEWRPNYYVITDTEVLESNQNEINRTIKCPIFFSLNSLTDFNSFTIKNGLFYQSLGNSLWFPPDNRSILFSNEGFIIYWGATVTYECIQIASFMGFKEMYLLGMDHNFNTVVTDAGELRMNAKVINHFEKRYSDTKVFKPQFIDTVNAAFRSAEKYSRENGFRIFNATRGGKLEIFERVDFDKLF